MKLGAKDFLEMSCPDRRLARSLREAFRARRPGGGGWPAWSVSAAAVRS